LTLDLHGIKEYVYIYIDKRDVDDEKKKKYVINLCMYSFFEDIIYH